MFEPGSRMSGARARLLTKIENKDKPMPRAPSYDFERRERQKAKQAKRAEKTKAKAEKREIDANISGQEVTLNSNDNEPR